jgi:hypothetical protein
MNPRKPTAEEKQELVAYVANQQSDQPSGEELKEAKMEAEGWLEHAAVSVFDNYSTDSPGYTGKLLVVVWPASPTLTETYIWRDGHIVNIPIEEAEKRQFNPEQLQAIEEWFNDAVKDYPEDKLYQSIHRKAAMLVYGEDAA